MFLLINLAELNIINLILFNKEKQIEKTYPGRNRDLLVCLDDLLQKNNLKKENLKGIMVVVGSGGFTSTRIATVIANTLGYTLHIPLLAIEKKDIKKIQAKIPELIKQPLGQYITASYSGKPNIGIKKEKK